MPSLFDPITIRDLTLNNRIMVSPMCQYQAEASGVITDWHVVHYGSLALGGPGLVMVEATAVESRGRITAQDVGLYDDVHIRGLRHIVEFAHCHDVRMGIQLAHAGRKADLEEETIAPSPVAFSSRYKQPREMTQRDIEAVVEAFRRAAQRAVQVGFDCIEIHAAHGYLLHQFLSPISNQRNDEYGGSRENRARFPRAVVEAVRKVLPGSMPLFVRVSATEYSEQGYSFEDMIYYVEEFKRAGADLIDVSSGGNLPVAPPEVYPGYQVPFAHRIKRSANIPVSAVGMLENPHLAEAVVREGRADMVAIARGFLRDKHWGHTAALALGREARPPKPYVRAY